MYIRATSVVLYILQHCIQLKPVNWHRQTYSEKLSVFEYIYMFHPVELGVGQLTEAQCSIGSVICAVQIYQHLDYIIVSENSDRTMRI